jgi:hypothetical protein
MNEAQVAVMEDIEAEVTVEELTVHAISPRAEVTRTESGVDITITDVDGTHTASLHDGQTGPQGPTGQAGPAGAPGISPSITITDITGGIGSRSRTRPGRTRLMSWMARAAAARWRA